MQGMLQMSRNVAIMFYNFFVAARIYLSEIPYFRLGLIIVTAYFVHVLLTYEVAEIKSPHTKASRRKF